VTSYTDDEGKTLRTAVFGAMVLVSTADPGALHEETYAGIRAMAGFSPDVRAVLGASTPVLPQGSVEDVEQGVLSALRQSMAILEAKSALDAKTFPEAVATACREVAQADGRVAEAEDAVVAKVRAALES
jgi:hypothetical protein